MIAHICLHKLRPEITEERLETMMAQARVQLLRVPEVLVVRTGKRIKPTDPWEWYVAIEVESLDKLAICQDDPNYIKFREDVVKPAVAESCVQSFEMDPRKDVKYS
ncbi:MAG: Dabb family protein [Verrucomicrobiaceae bacterium]|nr:Dabb family protein [Verrucomicrobiaceae bacterium]